MINIYVPKEGALEKTFLTNAGVLAGDTFERVPNQELAEVVLLTDSSDLCTYYNIRQLFWVIGVNSINFKQLHPTNVCFMSLAYLFNMGGGFYLNKSLTEHRRRSYMPKAEVHTYPDLVFCTYHYKILIIDYEESELLTAKNILEPHHMVVTACSVYDAIRILDSGGRYNAVLTDMQLRPDKCYGSLNLSYFGITETIAYGFAVVLEATSRGIPVAVLTVTDQSRDWVSAMFEKIKETNVNGQKVLFFNKLGKRWDKALKALLEPDGSYS